MAREAGSMVTFDDLLQMVLDGEIKFKASIPSSDECITYGELATYVNYDPLPFAGGYENNRLVPYHKIYQTIYSDPDSLNLGYTGSTTTFDLHNPIGEAWTITDNQSWFSCSPENGVTATETITVTFSTNINGTPRGGTITLTSASGATAQITVSQIANPGIPTDAIVLNRGLVSGDRCATSNQGTYYIPDGQSWNGSTFLYYNSIGTVNAPSGWYSDGTHWKEWNGSSFINSGIC